MGWKVPHGVREADLLRSLRHPSASGLRPWTPGILALSEILDFAVISAVFVCLGFNRLLICGHLFSKH